MLQMKLVVKYDYSPLWKTMKETETSQYELLKNNVIDNKTLDGLKKGKNITLKTVGSLCQYMDCTPNDIVKFIYDYEYVERKKKTKKKKTND